MKAVPIETAVSLLDAGGLVVFPTETLWSLSCRAEDAAAARRILEMKGRPEHVAMAAGFPNWEAARPWIKPTPLAEALAARFLPGPLTLVVERADDRLAHLAPGRATVGIRVPDHPVAQGVLEGCSPLIMTSANRHGAPDPVSREDLAGALAGATDVVVVAGPSVRGQASTVVDCTGEEPVVLREGAISATDLDSSRRGPET